MEKINVYSPCEGVSIPLERVKDEVFSQKMLGDGIAIQPHENIIRVPIDGEIQFIADTKHAVFIQVKENLVVMIHIGIDSVYLKGKGLTICLDRKVIKRGDPLIKIDQTLLESGKVDFTTIITVSSMMENDDYQVTQQRYGDVNTHDILFQVISSNM